jgi:hypothetical protein
VSSASRLGADTDDGAGAVVGGAGCGESVIVLLDFTLAVPEFVYDRTRSTRRSGSHWLASQTQGWNGMG